MLLEKRNVVLGAQLAGFVVAAVLTGMALAGSATAMVLLGSAFALGMGSAFRFQAWQAMLPELVSKARWPSAITLGSIAVNLARSLGPTAGGLPVGLALPPWSPHGGSGNRTVTDGVQKSWFLAKCQGIISGPVQNPVRPMVAAKGRIRAEFLLDL